MAARDRYTVYLSCFNCETTGIAEVSEDDYIFMKKLHFRVDRLDSKFKVLFLGENLAQTNFSCAICGSQAY